MSDEKYQLIITRRDTHIFYGYFCGQQPVELYCEPEKGEELLGNIYAARVDKTLKDIGAAFLEIAPGQKCYYALPKNGQKPVLLSPAHKGSRDDELRPGDLILAQITKDGVKSKLPVADGNISIPGKYFVLTLSDLRFGISKKINDKEERKRLSDIAAPFADERVGIIVRTNAAGISEEELRRELTLLIADFNELMRKASFAPGKTLLYRNKPHYITYPIDLPKKELARVLTDDPDIFEELKKYYKTVEDEKTLKKLALYQDDYPLWKLYRFETHYEQALNRHVWLPSGGSLVIEPTEAMVVIDVNTAGVVKKKGKEEDLFFQINREAACEIARQLRLRNLSGIIIIDFINMRYESHKKKLLTCLREECAKDHVRTTVVDITQLNLVEMTRQKVRKPLHEQINRGQIN